MRVLFLPVALAGLAIVAPKVRAQDADFSLPPSGVLPNYGRVPVGQREGLEGGAYVARTDDAGAAWYNPAGLALSEKSGLNASANAYEVNTVKVEGIGETSGGTRFSPTGTYLGGVLGAPIIRSQDFRLAFYYAKPISWTPGIIDGAFRLQDGASTESSSYSSAGGLGVIIPGLAAGVRVTSAFRVGASIGWAIVGLHQNQAIGDQVRTPVSDTLLSRAFVTDGSTGNLLFTGGVQWDLAPSLTLGAKVVSPGVRVGGKSKVVYSNLASSVASGSRQVSFRDEEATFRYDIPIEVTGGLAWHSGDFQVEADLRYHGSSSAFQMLSSTAPGELVVVGPDGVPFVSTIAFAPVVEAWRSVVNVHVGGNVRLGKLLRVHAGFFTDNSPVSAPATSTLRSIDLLGTSAGATISGRHLSGSLGLAASWGTTSERQIGPSLGGRSAVTRLTVRTFSILYSLSYSF